MLAPDILDAGDVAGQLLHKGGRRGNGESRHLASGL
jgi:hypothetical protein